MIERIIKNVVEAYTDYEGLDELRRGFGLALAMSGMDFTGKEKKDMFTEILYRLAK